MRKLREEVDEVLGDEPVKLSHIAQLKYTSGASVFVVPSVQPPNPYASLLAGVAPSEPTCDYACG